LQKCGIKIDGIVPTILGSLPLHSMAQKTAEVQVVTRGPWLGSEGFLQTPFHTLQLPEDPGLSRQFDSQQQVCTARGRCIWKACVLWCTVLVVGRIPGKPLGLGGKMLSFPRELVESAGLAPFILETAHGPDLKVPFTLPPQ